MTSGSLRIGLSAPPGALAENPESVFRAVLSAALSDGADEDDWVDRVVKAAGASTRSVGVNGTPKWRVIDEMTKQQQAIYDRAMASAVAEIKKILESAAPFARPPLPPTPQVVRGNRS
jgi:hypothetical protein